jgi:hypothetical protein
LKQEELKTSFKLHRSAAFSDVVQSHVLELGALLAQLEASHQSCIKAVDQAQHLAKEDNIRSVVSRTVSAHRLPLEVHPHSLLHLFEKQLKLYDDIIQEVKNSTESQAELLKMIKVGCRTCYAIMITYNNCMVHLSSIATTSSSKPSSKMMRSRSIKPV